MTTRHLLAVAACFFITSSTVQAENLNWSSRKIQLTVQRDHTDAPVPTGISLRNGTDEMAVVGDDHLVRIKNRSTGKLIRLFETHTDWIKIAKYHPNGKSLFTAGDDHSIFVWNADNAHDYSRFAKEDRAIEGLAIDNAGEFLATVGFNNKLNIYDVADRKLIRTLECPCEDMRAVQFSPNSELVAVGGRSGVVRVYRVADGSKVMDLAAHTQRIRDLEFANNQTILTCSDDYTVKLIEIEKRTATALLKRDTKFFSIAFLGSNRVAVGSSDNLIRVIDIGAKTEVGTLKGHSGTICELVADGNELISGSFDTEIRVWTIETSFVKTTQNNAAKGQVANRFQSPVGNQENVNQKRFNQKSTKQKIENEKKTVVTQLKPPKQPSSTPSFTSDSSFVIPSGKPNLENKKNNTVNFSNSGFQIKK